MPIQFHVALVILVFHHALPLQHDEFQLSLLTPWTLVLSPSWSVECSAHVSQWMELDHVEVSVGENHVRSACHTFYSLQ